MKIFYGVLVVMVSVLLLFLPITSGVYDFRTDVKEDTFRVETAGGTTTNVTLLKAVYDDDASTIEVTSDDGDDSPAVVAYHTGTRLLDISGLDTATNRTLTVSYDYDALSASAAISTFIDKLGWIWLIMIICFPIAAIVAIVIMVRR